MNEMEPKQLTRKLIHRYLMEFLASERQDLWAIVVYGIFVSICSLVIPITVQTFVNTVGFGRLTQPILILTLIVFFVLSFSSVIRNLQTYVAEVLQQRIFAKMAVGLAVRIPKIDPEIYYRHHGHELVDYFFDIVTVQKSLAYLILDGTSIALQVFFGMVLLAFYHPYLLAFDIITVSFVFLFIFGLSDRAITTSISESKAKYSVAAWLAELAKNKDTFRTVPGRRFALEKADQLTADYVRQRKGHFRILLKQMVSSAILQVIASSLLLGVGGWLVVKKQLTLGQLVASELVVTSVVAAIGKFGKYLESYYDLIAAGDKLRHLNELPIEREDGRAVSPSLSPVKTLSVQGLSFQNEEQRTILSRISFSLGSGSSLALLGESGSGKTVLSKMLYGLVQPTEGNILFQGIDIRNWSLNQLRSQIAYIHQIELFDGSLLENIEVSNTGCDIRQIHTILEKLDAMSFIQSFKNGLLTQVRAGQTPLSRSQALKIMVARAALLKPSLYILDECVDQMDEATFHSVFKFLTQYDPNCSIIVTTHRSETAQKCNSVIRLNQISPSGGHSL